MTSRRMSLCANDAAIKAATEVTVQMASDSDMREKRLADRLDSVVKKSVNEVVAGISESLHGRMTSLEAKKQNLWETFEKEVGGQSRAAGTRFQRRYDFYGRVPNSGECSS